MLADSAPAQAAVRRVQPGDWQDLRALRLEALADTPIAFCERLEDALAAADDSWRARAARGAEGGESFQVLAWDAEGPVATSVGFLDPERPGTAVLAAVYVAPRGRGAGLLAELVGSVADWASATGATRLRLLVHESNARARAAYAKLGFRETGRTEQYPLEAGGLEIEMDRSLPPAERVG